jgi:molecular chaperone DnaK (HSP70)
MEFLTLKLWKKALARKKKSSSDEKEIIHKNLHLGSNPRFSLCVRPEKWTLLTVGIEIAGGLMSSVVKRGHGIPFKKVQTFSSSEDNQDAMFIEIYEGERETM